MQYMFLIYGDEKAGAEQMEKASEEERAAYMGAWFAYDEELKKAGVFKGGEALQPTPTGKTVRLGGDGPITTDGPFAETKEQLGGYYVVECENLDEALKWASKCPGVKEGCVEVRPVMTFG